MGHDVVGFDNKKMIATNEAYNSVNPCCKYRDEEVVLDHKGAFKTARATPGLSKIYMAENYSSISKRKV